MQQHNKNGKELQIGRLILSLYLIPYEILSFSKISITGY